MVNIIKIPKYKVIDFIIHFVTIILSLPHTYNDYIISPMQNVQNIIQLIIHNVLLSKTTTICL